ncbi:MAG: hypothetical protein WCY11_08725 [Novosphingobium sp.]
MSKVVSLADHRRRSGYRIILRAGYSTSFEVAIEPPTKTHRPQKFRTYQEAMGCACAIQRAEGWPLFSNCDDDTPPEGDAA